MNTSPLPESHPMTPFHPQQAQLLMLGSFPPPKARWSIDFYYPNFQNDMWRILGDVFFSDKEYFIVPETRCFDKDKIILFCKDKGIALFDTASVVRRLNANASDKFLEIVEPTDIIALLKHIPLCRNIVVTGQKAADTLTSTLHCDTLAVGDSVSLTIPDRELTVWRMPSSSRAYPLSFDRKADAYRNLFRQIGML